MNRTQRSYLATAALWGVSGCGGQAPIPPPPPAPTLAIEAPWRIQEQDADHVVMRLGDSSNGVRIQLSAADGWTPGVTPIRSGHTFATGAPARTPMVAVPWPERAITSADITVDGVDLVIRLTGPPLDEVTATAEAPRDPALTWLRIRVRSDDWRIVLTGVGVIALPGDDLTGELDAEGHTRLATRWGRVAVQTGAKTPRSSLTADLWTLDLRPSIDRMDPYPVTAMTWSPR